MAGDPTKAITKENNEGKWESLVRYWKMESRPGTIVLPKESYQVYLRNDIPEFWPEKKSDAYESRSL